MQEICSSNPPVITGIYDPNKSRARHHRSLKLGSKLKYLNMRSIFLEKSYAKCGAEASRTSCHKKSKSLDQQPELLWSLFLLYIQVEAYQNLLKLRCWSLAFTSIKTLNKVWNLVSLPHFLHDFWRKIFFTQNFIYWPNFIVWLSSLLEILGKNSGQKYKYFKN